MQNNSQPAQTGLKNGAAKTRCSICRDKGANKREAINRALGKGFSHKDIEAMTGIPSRTVGNHAQHLPAIYREAKEKGILNQSIDVYTELREQLSFTKDLRTAAREYLSDPETGNLVLFPRSDEITVVYEDLNDRTAQGEPKRKRDSLEYLLERAALLGKVNPVQTITRHVDIRSFALDAVKTADTVLDKFARIAGVFEKDNRQKQTQPTDINQTARDFFDYLIRNIPGLPHKRAIEAVMDKYPGTSAVFDHYPISNQSAKIDTEKTTADATMRQLTS